MASERRGILRFKFFGTEDMSAQEIAALIASLREHILEGNTKDVFGTDSNTTIKVTKVRVDETLWEAE